MAHILHLIFFFSIIVLDSCLNIANRLALDIRRHHKIRLASLRTFQYLSSLDPLRLADSFLRLNLLDCSLPLLFRSLPLQWVIEEWDDWLGGVSLGLFLQLLRVRYDQLRLIPLRCSPAAWGFIVDSMLSPFIDKFFSI